MSLASDDSVCLDYHFSEQEIRILARIFRNHQEELPDGIIGFASKVERVMYNSMSIDEAEAFYS